MSSVKVFRSDEGRDKIRNYYNMILGFFPYAKKYVETEFGKTFYIEAGNTANPDLVLIHGSCSNTSSWLGDIPSLAEHFHVIAVDIPGEPGNSEEKRLEINSDEYPRWLKSFFDAIGLTKTAVMGNSLGGWLALHFSAGYPEMVASLVLLAPAGIVPARQAFITLTESDDKVRKNAAPLKDVIFGNTSIPKEVMDFLNLVGENFIPVTGSLPLLSDEKMLSLNMPVLFIGGKNDMTADMDAAAKRLSKHVSGAEIIMNEGSHVIMNSAGMVLPFLKKGLV